MKKIISTGYIISKRQKVYNKKQTFVWKTVFEVEYRKGCEDTMWLLLDREVLIFTIFRNIPMTNMTRIKELDKAI